MKNLKCLCFFFILCSIRLQAQNPNTWTRVADFPGVARAGVISFNLDSFGYVGLGESWVDSTLQNIWPTDFWQYNPYTNVWKQVASFPGLGRLACINFVINSKAYIGMGYNEISIPDSSLHSLTDFWEYDPALDTWTQKANFPAGYRMEPISFSAGNNGYAGMGDSIGNTDIYKKDIWQYDPVADTWTQKNDFPGPGMEGSLFTINDYAYVGYGQNSQGNILYDFWRYSSDSDSWTQLNNLRLGTSPDFSFTIGEKAYIDTFSYDSLNDISGNTFEEYEPSSDLWIPKDSFSPGARYGMASFSIGNRGFAGLGEFFVNHTTGPVIYYNDFWMYTPDSIETGIKSIDQKSIAISPNPTTDKIYVNISLTNFTLTISDMTGRIWPALSSGQEIDVSALPAGVYCLRMQSADGMAVRKFVKE